MYEQDIQRGILAQAGPTEAQDYLQTECIGSPGQMAFACNPESAI